jgi:hypothetical protein
MRLMDANGMPLLAASGRTNTMRGDKNRGGAYAIGREHQQV